MAHTIQVHKVVIVDVEVDGTTIKTVGTPRFDSSEYMPTGDLWDEERAEWQNLDYSVPLHEPLDVAAWSAVAKMQRAEEMHAALLLVQAAAKEMQRILVCREHSPAERALLNAVPAIEALLKKIEEEGRTS